MKHEGKTIEPRDIVKANAEIYRNNELIRMEKENYNRWLAVHNDEVTMKNHPNKNDFEEFGRRIGVSENRIEKLMAPYLEKQPFVEVFIGRSFLTEANQRGYLMMYQTKRNYLMEK